MLRLFQSLETASSLGAVYMNAEIARVKKVSAGKHFMPDFQMSVKTNFDILKLILRQRGLREYRGNALFNAQAQDDFVVSFPNLGAK